MSSQEYNFFNIYIMVLIMYTIYFLLPSDLAKPSRRVMLFWDVGMTIWNFVAAVGKILFVAATILLITNSVFSLIYSVGNKSIANIVFSSMMLCVGLLMAYYYVNRVMKKPKPITKDTTVEEWVEKNIHNRDFQKQLEKKLRSYKRYGKDSKISKRELRKKFNEIRVSKLRQQRTLDKKIGDLKTIAQLRSKPTKQRTRELNTLLLENPTFAQEVVQAVKSEMPQTSLEQNKKTLKTILQEPILEQPLKKMLSVFGQSTKNDQQSQAQFFEKLETNLAKTRATSMKEGKPFRPDEFSDKFLNKIEGKDPSIWLRKTATSENMTDKQLLNIYTSKIISEKRAEERARARKIGRASSSRRRR